MKPWVSRSFTAPHAVLRALGTCLVAMSLLLAGAMPAHASSTLNTVIATLTPGGNFNAIVAHPDGTRMYVPDITGNAVLVLSTASMSVLTSIPVDPGPNNLAISPNGLRLYVIEWASNKMSIIDTTTNTVVDTLTLPGDPREIAVTPDGTKFLLTDLQNGTVRIYSTSNDALLQTVTTGAGARYLAISADSSTAYVANILDSSISRVNLSTYASTRIGLSSNARSLLLSNDGSRVYVGHSSAPELSIVSTATNAVTTATIGVSANYLAENGNTLLVASYPGPGYITSVRTDTFSVLFSSAIPGGRSKGVFVSHDGSTVYTLDDSAQRAFALSTADGAIIAAIPMDTHMSWAAFTVNGGDLYVVASSGWIAIIDTFVASSSDEFDAPMQQFSVPAGTAASDCGALAPDSVDWPALVSMRGNGWRISYAEWPNEHAGGWVCSRQPHLSGTTWRFL